MTTTGPSLTRGQKRRIQIIEVAASLFNERGYHETSMDAIAEVVGVRKASLYYHFASKDKLLVEIHRDMIELITTKQEQRAGSTQSPREQLLGIMNDLITLMESHPGHLRIFFEHFRELPAGARTETSVQRDHYRQLVMDVLETGRRDGTFTFEDTFLTTMHVLGTCNWAYQWFRTGAGRTAAQTAAYFHAELMRGLASATG